MTGPPSPPLEERVGERRPPCRKATAAQVCKPVDAPLPTTGPPSPPLEERVGERRPPCRKATAAQVCKPVDALLPNPLPALGWRGEGEISGGSVKMRSR